MRVSVRNACIFLIQIILILPATSCSDKSYADDDINHGAEYLDAGDYESAIAMFDKAISHDPASSDAYNYRGLTYYEMDQPVFAMSDLDKSIELDPDNCAPHDNLGLLFKSLEDFDTAMESFNRSIKLFG
jgi:Tfp pilus assembly protein PilF